VAGIYRRILGRIERAPEDAPRRRTSLSACGQTRVAVAAVATAPARRDRAPLGDPRTMTTFLLTGSDAHAIHGPARAIS
jgi:hypothetical protein